jgi:flagellar basal-body rod protein FlgG
MDQTMYIATSGALAQQMRLEVLANNLSNSNTVGFKEDKTVFREYLPLSTPTLAGNPSEGSSPSTGSLQADSYVMLERTMVDFSPGQLRSTGNRLDFALNGNGFFCVETPGGTLYTRNGNFTLDKDGILVTQEGLPVLGNKTQIRLSGGDVTVDKEGNISENGSVIDRLRVVDFTDHTVLTKAGDSCFVPADPSITAQRVDQPEISQGFIEMSNVDTVRVMTEMIETLRAYESYQKVIQSYSDVTTKAINEVGSLQ